MAARPRVAMRAVAAIGVVVLLVGCGSSAPSGRPDFQRTLDALVTGPHRLAPGVTAFVSGPHTTWSGSAGWANVTMQIRMTPDARLRLESVSKLWTATVARQARSRAQARARRHGRALVARALSVRQPDHGPRAPEPHERDGRQQRLRPAAAVLAGEDPDRPRPHLSDNAVDPRGGGDSAALRPGESYRYSNIGYETRASSPSGPVTHDSPTSTAASSSAGSISRAPYTRRTARYRALIPSDTSSRRTARR